MSIVRTEPVEAQLLDSIVAKDAPAGGIKFYNDGQHKPAGFHFRCPCGCDLVGGVKVTPNGWRWNGNRDRPTVQPSVHLFGTDGKSHWHGFLTDGVWRSV